jgi:hypothetical protein
MNLAFCSQRLTPGGDEQTRFNDEEQKYVASSRRSHEGRHGDAVALFNTDVPSADTLPQQAKAAWSVAQGCKTETLYRDVSAPRTIRESTPTAPTSGPAHPSR